MGELDDDLARYRSERDMERAEKESAYNQRRLEFRSLTSVARSAVAFLEQNGVPLLPAYEREIPTGRGNAYHVTAPARWDIRIPLLDESHDLASGDGHLSLLPDGRIGVIVQYQCDKSAEPGWLGRKMGRSQEYHWRYRFTELSLGPDGEVWFDLGSRRFAPAIVENALKVGLMWLVEGQHQIRYRKPLQ